LTLCLLAAVLAPLAAAPAVNYILVNGMVEGPDPIPTSWPAVLEATGGESPEFGCCSVEAPAAVAFDPETGNPAVVWNPWVGGDRDIAFAEWDGDEWDKTEFLSSGTEDDIDPRIVFEEDGRAFVVWWHEGETDQVFLSRRDEDGDWLPAQQWHGRRPAIAALGHDVHIVFERPGPGGLEIVHVVAGEEGELPLEPLVRVRRSVETTQAGLHRQGQRLWAYWQHTPNKIGWSEYDDDRWEAPDSLP
jgi:hypothetical protein